jgi:curved DNA-binding protein CbpA
VNPYEELGVTPDATTAQVNSAFRKRAAQTHPDTGGDRDAFDRATRAIAVLRDPTARARFDRTGEMPDDGPKVDPNAQAANLLAQVFTQLFDEEEWPEDVDMVAAVKAHLRRMRKAVDEQTAELFKKKKRWDDAAKRLKVNAGAGTHIRATIEAQVRGISAALTQAGERAGLVDTAIALAENYSWTVDPGVPPPVHVYQGFGRYGGPSQMGTRYR